MKGTKKIFNDVMTEDDGKTHCIAKWLSAIAFFAYLAYAGYGLCVNHTTDLATFGSGLMQVLIGCGTIIAGKQVFQKDQSDKPTS